MANATEAILSPSQLVGVDFIVRLSSNSNYLLHLDLIPGRRDLSCVEAHHDVSPTSLRIALGSISRLWRSQIANRAGRLMNQARRPGNSLLTSVALMHVKDMGAAARATILRGAHGHRRRAADDDQGL
jgi:hypothetical protein